MIGVHMGLGGHSLAGPCPGHSSPGCMRLGRAPALRDGRGDEAQALAASQGRMSKVVQPGWLLGEGITSLQ